MFQEFSENLNGKDFVCGDIHGCYDKLMDALEKANFDRDVDRLFCVGDLVDRGPDPIKCVKLLDEPWFHSILGNHELMTLSAIAGRDVGLSYVNGGDWIAQYSTEFLNAEVADRFMKLPLCASLQYNGKSFLLVHAEIIYNGTLEDLKYKLSEISPSNIRIGRLNTALSELVWGRSRLRSVRASGKIDDAGQPSTTMEHDVARLEELDHWTVMPSSCADYVIHGHTIVHRPIKVGNFMYIDTGSYIKGCDITVMSLGEVINFENGE